MKIRQSLTSFLLAIVAIGTFCLATPAHSQSSGTQVYECQPIGSPSNTATQSGNAPPTTPLPIVVSQTNPSTSSTGLCELAASTPNTWFTRATTDGSTYQWVTLASLGIGMSSGLQTSTLTVSWAAPTGNTDGSTPVTPLSGYSVCEGAVATSLPNCVTITNPATLTYTSPLLTPGTYFYEVIANAADGLSSSPSAIVSGTIVAPKPKLIPGQPTSVTIRATLTATAP